MWPLKDWKGNTDAFLTLHVLPHFIIMGRNSGYLILSAPYVCISFSPSPLEACTTFLCLALKTCTFSLFGQSLNCWESSKSSLPRFPLCSHLLLQALWHRAADPERCLLGKRSKPFNPGFLAGGSCVKRSRKELRLHRTLRWSSESVYQASTWYMQARRTFNHVQ